MDLISAIRSQVPVQQPPAQPPAERGASAVAPESARPVAETLRRDAVRAPGGSAAQVSVQLADRDAQHHPAADARAAALAAREAYIKASIAAGISPLPLP